MREAELTHIADRIKAAWVDASMKVAKRGLLRSAVLAGAPRAGTAATVNELGERGILLPLRPREGIAHLRSVRKLSGVMGYDVARFARDGAVEDAGAEKRQLHIWCRDQTAADAFASFCGLLCERVAHVSAVQALDECVDEFRRLLVEPSAGAGDSLLGLLGELLFLEQLLDVDADAVACWQGPRGERHDFRRGVCAIEVKTTLRALAAGYRVRISSLDQLEPPDDGRLFLHLVRLEQVAEGAFSPRELQERIEARLSPPDTETFRSLLKSGTSLPDSPRFSVMEKRTWKVDDGFPRLTPAHLLGGRPAAGVSGISYDLDLSNAAAFAVPVEDAVREVFREL